MSNEYYVCKWCGMNQQESQDYLDQYGDDLEEEEILVRLMAREIIFCNTTHWDSDDPERISLFVNCNDLFAWALAEGEEISLEEIKEVYEAWRYDEKWGVDKWVCRHRNQKPQPPIVEDMKKDGAWDDEMEALPDNHQDGETKALFSKIAQRIFKGR